MESQKNTCEILLKRAYDASSATDGYRIYVDRLWPQGLSHETFKYDWWDKSISPSPELRQWFHADPATRWPEFVEKYESELKENPAFASLQQVVSQHHVVTLLYSSHDRVHNTAVVLRDMLLLPR